MIGGTATRVAALGKLILRGDQDMADYSGLKVARLKSGAPAHDERRKSTRHTVSAVVKVVDVRSGTRLTTRASDLGLGGCYVDTLTPFPVGTQVALELLRDRTVIALTGKIVYSHPGLGMGIAFVDAEPEHRASLEEWLESLSQATAPAPEAQIRHTDSAGDRNRYPSTTGAEARGAMERLLNLLLAKGTLTEDDVEMILQKRKTPV
jgi:PilZ domain-containing protein